MPRQRRGHRISALQGGTKHSLKMFYVREKGKRVGRVNTE